MVRYRVGILGMGKIASGFDAADAVDHHTHIQGIVADPRLELVAVADRDAAHAAAELQRFGLHGQVVSPADLLAMDLDIVCIATPDETHMDYAERAIEGPARIVLVEKPLGGDMGRRQRLLQAADAGQRALVVNHLRRWIPGLQDWQGRIGRPISAVATYNRGFRHNGVHALDLVGLFLGTDVTAAHQIGPAISDFSVDDPTLSLQIAMRSDGAAVPFTLIGVDGRQQSAFEVDIRFAQARLRIFDEDGVRAIVYKASAATHPGFSAELAAVDNFHDKPARLSHLVWRNLADHLERGDAIACAGADALMAYDFIDAVMERLHP